MSSAKGFTFDMMLLERSSIDIRKSNGHKTDPWGTSDFIGNQLDD